MTLNNSPRGLPVKELIPLKSARKVMAKAMKTSIDSTALSQVTREIDVTALKNLQNGKLAEAQPKISLNTLIMGTVARTLPDHGLLNAELLEREILVYEPINLGMAVATPEGLIVVVIPEANKLTLAELALAIERKLERTRSGSISLKDVEGGTFTVSNLGMYGVDTGFPLPRPPESAILLMGAVRAKPIVIDEEIVVRDLAWFSLCFDHRIIDGATAATFLQDLNQRVSHPESLLGSV